MKLYNTLSKKLEDFKPLHDVVRIYSCGPTVYNYVHIGNLRTFIFEDLLRRYLLYKGYKLKQVKNLTDVDDKTIRDSKKEGLPLNEFTEKYTKAFFDDIDALNIQRAEEFPKATDHINEMVSMIQHLLQNGLAYKADDGIYFSINKFENYGKLAHINLAELQAGASGRVQADEYDKEHASDFALWKYWDKNDGDVYWETPIGKGRPGWHIECSAMSAKHLTKLFHDSAINTENFETIDIHTGGIDLVFPHHQDEIAQTEGCVSKPFVNYWLHAEHLLVNNKKMSKSLGNFYTLRDILNKGYNPLAVRYLLLSTHYRQKLNFTLDSLDAAATAVQRINDFLVRLTEVERTGPNSNDHAQRVEKYIAAAREAFERNLDDDLNISPALATLFEFMNNINSMMEHNHLSQDDSKAIIAFMHDIDSVLGVFSITDDIDADAKKLLKEREEARANKEWAKADELRDKLKTYDIAVEDTPHGQRWKKIL